MQETPLDRGRRFDGLGFGLLVLAIELQFVGLATVRSKPWRAWFVATLLLAMLIGVIANLVGAWLLLVVGIEIQVRSVEEPS